MNMMSKYYVLAVIKARSSTVLELKSSSTGAVIARTRCKGDVERPAGRLDWLRVIPGEEHQQFF